jgi:hypothetical protein
VLPEESLWSTPGRAVWYQYLSRGLRDLGFMQSKVDECVFYKGTWVLLVYVDDTIILGPNEIEMRECIKLLKSKFKLGEEGNLCDYLKIKITRKAEHEGIPFNKSFPYRSVIGKLNYLEISMRPELAYAVPQYTFV